jgi:O-phospho-L-seryl-tRNASec:L-selenocysteinyl-tRNA synthase
MHRKQVDPSTMEPDDIVASFTALKIPKTHAVVGLSNLIASNKQYRSLFVNRRLPDAGWSDVQIQHFIFLLSTLDTNNKTLVGSDSTSDESRWCGVGEREGRVYSSLVSQRHYGLSHGMGRSGDITEPQPKAVGSSVLVKLTLLMVLDAVRRGSGLNPKTAASHGILLPLCTGMSTSLVLSSLRTSAGDESRNIVLWSRIDQKSCFKAILSAGLKCVVIPTMRDGDQVVTDADALARALAEHKGRVLAVITTASCFAPRVPDKVDVVAKQCKEADVHHIINSAYGLQCAATSKLINRACVIGRVDAIVCSTDKNFLVPVGGAIVLSPDKDVIQNVGKMYAGRASSSPMVDLFITLLSMGLNGYTRLLTERSAMLETFPKRFEEVAIKYGERLLQCPANTISFGVTVDGLARLAGDDENETDYLNAVSADISKFGAMLFSRCVSGTRVVPRGGQKTISGHDFIGFGSSLDDYPHAYVTAACAIGVSKSEVDEFFVRLDKTFKEFKKASTK